MKDLYREMLRIRMIEEHIAAEYPKQEIRCPIHLSIGQEAQAVGVCAALSAGDKMVSTHRSHAHYLAKGGDLNAMVAELYGRTDGCSKGNGGSMHLIDERCGFMGSTSIVGGTIPVGVGLAFAAKLRGEDHVTAVMLGDAALEEGVFHESANFAALHKLKVVFVIEDNQYSCFTHKSKRQSGLDGFSTSGLSQLYGMNFWHVDEQEPYVIAKHAGWCIKNAPSILMLANWRHVQHCGPDHDDHLNYRNTTEIVAGYAKDPLRDVTFADALRAELQNEINGAFQYARS